MRDGQDRFRLGDHRVVDDRSGFDIYASEAVTEWNGAVVHRDDAEERHPQELRRAKIDRQAAREPVRPDPIPVFGGPLVTFLAADHAAGDTDLTVQSSARMVAGDFVRVMLDNGDSFRAAITSVVDSETIQIGTALPFAASTDKAVVDESAVAAADIG